MWPYADGDVIHRRDVTVFKMYCTARPTPSSDRNVLQHEVTPQKDRTQRKRQKGDTAYMWERVNKMVMKVMKLNGRTTVHTGKWKTTVRQRTANFGRKIRECRVGRMTSAKQYY